MSVRDAMDNGFLVLIKYLSQSLSVSEQRQLEEWRTSSDENNRLFSQICKLKLLREYQQRNNIAATALSLSRVQRKIKHGQLVSRLQNTLKYAAVAILLLSLTLFGWMQLTPAKYTCVTVAENESVKQVQLDDGSTVWLRSPSTLRIPKSYSSSSRELSLIGRAFFDVKPDKNSPFVIKNKDVDIEVVGTSFDLTVDPKDRIMEAILVSGKIVLQDNIQNTSYCVKLGEKVSYSSKIGLFKVVDVVDVNMLAAWYKDQIIFDRITFKEIVEKLNVIYNVKIHLRSPKLAERRYRLIISKEDSLSDVLNNIAYITPISYIIEDNEVYITD